MNPTKPQITEPRLAVRLQLFVPSLALAISLMAVGCGQDGYMAPSPAPPPPSGSTLSSMQGSWELIFHSDVSPNVYKAVEANLSQTGTHVFAGASNSLVYQTESAFPIRISRFGGQCDSGVIGDVTVDATLSNQGSTLETVSFTFTENGALGSVVTTASASTNGMSINGGTYSIPAACGFPEDHGTFGGYQESVRFSPSEVYSGTLNGSSDVIVAHFTSAPNSFDLTLSGTDNGGQFVLTGSAVGFSMTLTGEVAGKAVNWFALYDPTYNVFVIYDSNAKRVGGLHQGANAQSTTQTNRVRE